MNYDDSIKCITHLYNQGAHFVLCRDKIAFQKAWQKNAPTLEEIIAHYDPANGNHLGLIPHSLGYFVIDVDAGSPEDIFGYVNGAELAHRPAKSRKENGWHIYIKVAPDFKGAGNGKWKLGASSGDYRSDVGYVVIWDLDALITEYNLLGGEKHLDDDFLKRFKEAQQPAIQDNTAPSLDRVERKLPKPTSRAADKIQAILSQPMPPKGQRYQTLVENAGYLARVSPSHLEELRTLGLSWHKGPPDTAQHIHSLIDKAIYEWAPRDHKPNYRSPPPDTQPQDPPPEYDDEDEPPPYNPNVHLDMESGAFIVLLSNTKLTGFQEWGKADKLEIYYDVFDSKTYIKWEGMEFEELTDWWLGKLAVRIHQHARVEVTKQGEVFKIKAEFSKQRLADYVVFMSDKRDTAREFVEAIPAWKPDEEDPIIDRFLIDNYGAADDPLMRWASRYLWMAQVQRIMEPGCDLHEMPILKGPQGIGKSSLCRAVAIKPGWFAETNFGHDDKALAEIFAGKTVLEMTEWSTRNQRSLERQKAFISTATDRFRRPYAKFAEDSPRHCIFVGTTNDKYILPDDPSGNRRFIVAELTRAFMPWRDWTHEQNLRATAEARYWLYEAPNPIRANLPFELKADLDAQFEKHRDTDPIRDRVDTLNRKEGITSDILYKLVGWNNNPSPAERRRLRDNMEELGWSLAKRRLGKGVRKRIWATDEFNGNLAIVPDDDKPKKY